MFIWNIDFKEDPFRLVNHFILLMHDFFVDFYILLVL